MTSVALTPDHELEGDVDVRLAPVRGTDTRRQLPRTLFQRRPAVFVVKFLFASLLIAAGMAAVALQIHWAITAVAVVVLGLMYAHMVELQHECLHGHAFQRLWINRFFGVIAGVFMLSSHSHYRYQHLRHHAYLGTPDNKEFFDYRFQNLNNVPGFLASAFSLDRYKDVFRDMALSCMGRTLPTVTSARAARHIRTEYQLYALCLSGAIAFTLATGNPFFLIAWLLPSILIAEAAHFMIEMPEHYGLNTQTDDNVLTNTRTINASRIAHWYTNGNNLHTAHHYHQGVPMVRIPELHALEKGKFEVTEPSYWAFYKKVIRGELRHRYDASCMTR